jgi:hypothetical protein
MANYTVNIDGIDYPVINRPWETIGIYSDEMNLKNWAILMKKFPNDSLLKRTYDALLDKKQKSLDEISRIKQEQQLALNRKIFSPEFKEILSKDKQKRLEALKHEQEAVFNRNDVGGKKYKKCKKISNKRKKHSSRRRTHSRSKY